MKLRIKDKPREGVLWSQEPVRLGALCAGPSGGVGWEVEKDGWRRRELGQIASGEIGR